MAMNIDVSGLSDYTPYEGLGKSDLLSKDGIFLLVINKAVAGTSSESKREKITLALSITEDPEKMDDGKTLVHTVTVGGVDKNGKPMVRQLGDLLLSLGFSVDQIKEFAKKKNADLEDLCKKAITGKHAFGQCAAETYTAEDGQVAVSSKIQNFVPKAKYDEAVAVRAHRKAHRYTDGAPAAAGGLGGLGAPAGASTPGANGAAKPASGDLAGL